MKVSIKKELNKESGLKVLKMEQKKESIQMVPEQANGLINIKMGRQVEVYILKATKREVGLNFQIGVYVKENILMT